MSAIILLSLIGIGSEAKGVLAAITMPEPGSIATFTVYGAGLGLFVWYQLRRSKRSKL
jgi:hypothetical protein